MTENPANAICIPESLERFFAGRGRIALAFSGGVDSAYLLYAAKSCGCDVRPYYIKSVFQPEFEYNDARRFCEQIGIEMTVLDVDILCVPNVRENPSNRCYYCKTALFTRIIQQAKADGCEIVIDGTNASDDAGDRPGMKALHELQVLSPLRECGMTKDAIREYSRRAGLFTWDKHAYACLATRIPENTQITEDMLKRVEGAEAAVASLGFSDFRIRVYAGAARLQLPAGQMMKAVEMRSDIRKAVEKYFSVVMMDLKDR